MLGFGRAPLGRPSGPDKDPLTGQAGGFGGGFEVPIICGGFSSARRLINVSHRIYSQQGRKVPLMSFGER